MATLLTPFRLIGSIAYKAAMATYVVAIIALLTHMAAPGLIAGTLVDAAVLTVVALTAVSGLFRAGIDRL